MTTLEGPPVAVSNYICGQNALAWYLRHALSRGKPVSFVVVVVTEAMDSAASEACLLDFISAVLMQIDARWSCA